MDQRIGSYSCKSKSNRWTMVSLAYALDTACKNSQTVVAINNGQNPCKTNSFGYLCELGKALVVPHMNNRSLIGLQSAILKKRAMFLGLPLPGEVPQEALPSMTRHPKQGDAKRICHVCYSQLPHEDRRKAKVIKKWQ